MQLLWKVNVQLRLISAQHQLVQLLDGLLADMVELADGVVERRDVLLLQVLCPFGDNLQAGADA